MHKTEKRLFKKCKARILLHDAYKQVKQKQLGQVKMYSKSTTYYQTECKESLKES